MEVQVRLFALARQLAGCDIARLEVPEGTTVGDLRRRLGDQYPGLRGLIEQMMFAVDSEYADDRVLVGPQSDIGCIPPVSGGGADTF